MLTGIFNMLKGAKLVEVPYFANQLDNKEKKILIVGERFGEEGISETIKELGYDNVTTTDILPSEPTSWLRKNTSWEHIEKDFIEFDENQKYDFVISISVFEHFGFWFAGNRMANGLAENDTCFWNHDIKGINKACKLLRDGNSKLIITLPGGPYMNYEDSGEPFQRGYDHIRQRLIKKEISRNGFKFTDEKFYHSMDYVNWEEVSYEINDPKYYPYMSSFTPNLIWAFTIQKF
jgi:hypothetical protein